MPRYSEQLVFTMDDVNRELAKIRITLDLIASGEQEIKRSAPLKPKQGMVVVADGQGWNPGGGMGAYEYRGTTTASLSWVKL